MERTELERRRAQRHEARTSATYRRFLEDVKAMLDVDEPMLAEQALSTVLCLLSQRMFADEEQDLEAQLPVRVRELLSACPSHAGMLRRKFHAAEMVARVAQDLNVPEDVAEARIRAVFAVVAARVSAGEVHQVVHALPKDFWELWPEQVALAVELDDEQAAYRVERRTHPEPAPRKL